MNKIVQYLVKFDSRLVIGAMLLFVALLGLEGWQLLLKKAYANYQQVSATKASLQAAQIQSTSQLSGLAATIGEVEQLTIKLNNAFKLPVSDDETAASLIEALDHSAGKYGVLLASVEPQGKRTVSIFEEVSFNVSATGSYSQLSSWMLSFTNTLDQNMSITGFDMKADEAKQIALSLSIALYRPLKPNEVIK